MRAPRHSVLVLVCMLGLLPCASAQRRTDPWRSAVAARDSFEAQPAHTHADYAALLASFRAIYHADPADPHAAAAVEQVAELLAEEAAELHDTKSRRDAQAQYAFLLAQYPQSRAARDAAPAIVALQTPPVRAPQPARQLASETRPSRPAKPPLAPPQPIASADDASTADTIHTLARVTGIRHWSTSTYTRVAIDLGDDFSYQAARVENPDRIFFDIHHAVLAPELAGKSFTVTDDGFLTQIRAAQYAPDVTRVVLDVHEVADYSAFILPNPYRLIIDIHGKVPGLLTRKSSANTATVEALAPTPPTATAPPRSAATDTGASQLPPMPVTDGSASFGLPPASSSASANPPRVVIPTRATAARPVPNTVASRQSTTTVDVAAVSDQPGKIEATPHPTSAPIATPRANPPRSSASRAKSKSTTKPRDTDDGDAAPTDPAPPTADGQTLLRALGLKIGRIVIDAGHGGHDSGTLGAGGIEEKDVVLDVALRLGKLLHQRLGADIVYTRADDTFIPLETRTAIANKAQADLFISIHANSSQDPSARGVEVYYLNFTSDPEAMRVASRENAVSTQSVHELSDLVKKIALKDKLEESHELATDVDAALFAGIARGNDGLKDRGVKKAPFVVLIGANMPSILAEISFVTNPEDAAQLRTSEYRERVAESLYAGVAKYAGTINGAKSPKTMVASRAGN